MNSEYRMSILILNLQFLLSSVFYLVFFLKTLRVCSFDLLYNNCGFRIILMPERVNLNYFCQVRCLVSA